jgi:hypothetical protein
MQVDPNDVDHLLSTTLASRLNLLCPCPAAPNAMPHHALMTRKYDDAGHHDDPAVEAGQPPEQGFVHIGLYLGWVIKRGLHDPATFPEDHVAAVIDGSMTGSDLRDDVDGKLVGDMLSADGRAFTDQAYDWYLDAYGQTFISVPDYGVEDSPANAARVERLVDRAFEVWRAGGSIESVVAEPAADEDPPSGPADSDGVWFAPSASNGGGGPPRIRSALDLERILVDRLRLPSKEVSSVPASQWGSSLVTRALKRLAIPPRDAIVTSALAGDGPQTVMVGAYGVPGVAAADLEREFAGALHRPSSRPWTPVDLAGHRVLRSRDAEFDVVFWALDGLVLHLGATLDVDLAPLVAALSEPPLD